MTGRALTVAVFLGVLLGLASNRAVAQHDDGRLPLSFRLLTLAEVHGVDIIYEPSLVADLYGPELLPGASTEDQLSHLLGETDLAFSLLPSGAYAIFRSTPSDLGARLLPRPPPAARWKEPDAPRGVRLRGEVRDASTGAPLADAIVEVEGGESAAVTDEQGRFSILVRDSPPSVLLTSHASYAAQRDTVGSAEPASVRIGLRLTEHTLEPVVIEDRWGQRGGTSSGTSEGLTYARGVGIPDAVRSAVDTRGVDAEPSRAMLHIDGGASGEHRILLDRAPVFDPVHVQGLVGAFDPSVLRPLRSHATGFGVRHGSHLSGVLEAEHDFSDDGAGVGSHVDLLSAGFRAHFRRPETARPASLVMSVRSQTWEPEWLRTMLAEWSVPDNFLSRASLLELSESSPQLAQYFSDLLDGNAKTRAAPHYGFLDAHMAVKLGLGMGGTLNASVYRGQNQLASRATSLLTSADNIDTDVHDIYDWSNQTAQARVAIPLARSTLLSTQIRTSRYRLAHRYTALDDDRLVRVITAEQEVREIALDTRPADDGNFVSEHGVSATLDWLTEPGTSIAAGVEADRTASQFMIDEVYARPVAYEGDAWRLAAFAEGETLVTPHLTMTGGIRMTWLDTQQGLFAEPRLKFRFARRMWSAEVAGGIYRQFVGEYELSSASPSALLPSARVWLPLDSSVEPPEARHLSVVGTVGAERGWQGSFRAYAKNQLHLLHIDYATLWTRLRENKAAVAEAEFLRKGRGSAYGAVLSLGYTSERWRVRLSYERSETRRTHLSDTLIASPWNEPHRMKVNLRIQPATGAEVFGLWQGTWGRAWGFRQPYYNYLATDPRGLSRLGGIDFRDPESHTLPPLHTLDVGASYSRAVGPLRIRGEIALLNALDRTNVADWRLEVAIDEQGGRYAAVPRVLPRRRLAATVRVLW